MKLPDFSKWFFTVSVVTGGTVVGVAVVLSGFLTTTGTVAAGVLDTGILATSFFVVGLMAATSLAAAGAGADFEDVRSADFFTAANTGTSWSSPNSSR